MMALILLIEDAGRDHEGMAIMSRALISKGTV
jgi:hypothetical protein